jgi:hypothetical protein
VITTWSSDIFHLDVKIKFSEPECLYSISENTLYEYITLGISSLDVVQYQDERVAYKLSRAKLISLLVKGISTYLTAITVQNYMNLNTFEKVIFTQRVKKF